jgi:hypothetical protein
MDIEQFAAQNDIRDEDIPDLLSASAINAYNNLEAQKIPI